MVKLRERAKITRKKCAKPNAQEITRLSDEDVELLRTLYEEGRSMPESERRRRGLGYKGLARRFEIPKRTVRCYVHYLRRC